MSSRFFVTGTDTGVGKTTVCALLCAALDAVYWKPIQTGTIEGTDRETVVRLAGLPSERALPERYCFAPPVSPHLAARRAGVRIRLSEVKMPPLAQGDNLIAEGAGGVLVPINETQFMTDLMRHLRLPALLVSRTSLGTINHTLLSLAILRAAKIPVRGVIFSGPANPENAAAIEKYGCAPILGRVPRLRSLHRTTLLDAFRRHFDYKAFLA